MPTPVSVGIIAHPVNELPSSRAKSGNNVDTFIPEIKSLVV